jgi:hypothetical protein
MHGAGRLGGIKLKRQTKRLKALRRQAKVELVAAPERVHRQLEQLFDEFLRFMDDLGKPAISLMIMRIETRRLRRQRCGLEPEPGIWPAAKHLEQNRINLAALI